MAAVAHASTTTGYVIGHREEAAVIERIAQRFDVPAVSSCAAVAEALRTHGVGRVQLIHPPWFSREFDDLGVAYFRSQGVDAVVTKAVTLPARNGFRAAAAVEELEARTGRLVLEANQALLWGILAATGTGWDVTGHGRLLQATTATTQSHRLPPAAVARTEDPS